MKKRIFFIFIIIAFVIPYLAAQETNTIIKNVAITADFNFPAFDDVNLKADIKIRPDLSIGPDFDYINSKFNIGKNNYIMTGFGANIRYFWVGTAVHGYYVGELINYYTYKVNISTIDPTTGASASGSSSGNAMEYTTSVGYQSIWDNGFVFDIALGYQFILSHSTYTAVAFNDPTTGKPETDPYAVNHLFIYRAVLNIGIGYAF